MAILGNGYLPAPAVDGDPRAGRRQPGGDGGADALGGTGDQGRLPGKIDAHAACPCPSAVWWDVVLSATSRLLPG